MRYLLDTNVIIRYLNDDADTIQLLLTLARTASEPFFVSTVTQMEVWEGVHRATNPAQVEREYQAFFDDLTLPPSIAILRNAGRNCGTISGSKASGHGIARLTCRSRRPPCITAWNW